VGQEGDFAGAGFVNWSNFVNYDATVSYDSPSDMIGEFTERFACRHLFLRPAVINLYHPTRDIGCLIAVQDLRAFEDQGKLLRFSYFVDDLL
jgi:hypothetical protein